MNIGEMMDTDDLVARVELGFEEAIRDSATLNFDSNDFPKMHDTPAIREGLEAFRELVKILKSLTVK